MMHFMSKRKGEVAFKGNIIYSINILSEMLIVVDFRVADGDHQHLASCHQVGCDVICPALRQGKPLIAHTCGIK